RRTVDAIRWYAYQRLYPGRTNHELPHHAFRRIAGAAARRPDAANLTAAWNRHRANSERSQRRAAHVAGYARPERLAATRRASAVWRTATRPCGRPRSGRTARFVA